jgi:hypothetical protein
VGPFEIGSLFRRCAGNELARCQHTHEREEDASEGAEGQDELTDCTNANNHFGLQDSRKSEVHIVRSVLVTGDNVLAVVGHGAFDVNCQCRNDLLFD